MPEPPITTQAYHVSAGLNLPVYRLVIHSTDPSPAPDPARQSAPGQAAAVARYFTQASAGGSAHYVCDATREEHCIAEEAIAWHAPPNPHSLGIEICAHSRYATSQWLTGDPRSALERAAARAADICARHSLPLTWLSPAELLAGLRGITSHANVSAAWRQSDHTDPGPGFPVNVFMDLVRGGSPPVPTPAPAPDLSALLEEEAMAVISVAPGETRHLPILSCHKTFGVVSDKYPPLGDDKRGGANVRVAFGSDRNGEHWTVWENWVPGHAQRFAVTPGVEVVACTNRGPDAVTLFTDVAA